MVDIIDEDKPLKDETKDSIFKDKYFKIASVAAIVLLIGSTAFFYEAAQHTQLLTLQAAQSSGSNVVLNPGFEDTAKLYNWIFVTRNGNTPTWDFSVSHSGTKSVKIYVPGTTDVISGEVWSDNISTSPGNSYTISAWGKTQNAAGTNNPAVRVAELDSNGAWLRQTNIYFPKGTVNWNQQQATFTVGANTANLSVYANIWNGYGTFWVDDVVLTQNNQPTPTPTPPPPPPNAFYVSTTGNDANPGTLSQPWRTIQKAANTLIAGQIAYVRGGTYPEVAQTRFAYSGTASQHIVLSNYPGETVTLDGANVAAFSGWDGQVSIDQSYIDFIGIDIVNSKGRGISVYSSDPATAPHDLLIKDVKVVYSHPNWGSADIAFDTDNNAVLRNIVVDHVTVGQGMATSLMEGVSFHTVVNGVIKNSIIGDRDNSFAAPYVQDCILVGRSSAYITVENNTVNGCKNTGIYVDSWASTGSEGYEHDILVQNNTVQNINWKGIAVASELGVWNKIITVKNNLIYNCNCGDFAFGLSESVDASNPDGYSRIDTVTFANNVADGGNKGFETQTVGGYAHDWRNVNVENNIFINNGGGGIINGIGTNAQFSYNMIDYFRGRANEVHGTIEGDPLFADTANRDYHLKSQYGRWSPTAPTGWVLDSVTSPAIDAGDPAMSYDLEPVPNGGRINMGNYGNTIYASKSSGGGAPITPVPTTPVPGNAYYVSTTGNDNNPGTQSAPWRTIQKAANTVSAGKTVFVRSGTYHEKPVLSKSGSAGSEITYSAYPGETVTIDGNGAPYVGYWDGLVDITGSYTTFKNFHVINSGWAGVYVTDADHVTVQNNYISETRSSGVLTARGTNYNILSNELYRTSGYYCGDGQSQESISVQSGVDGFVVAKNYLHDVGVFGGCGAEGIDAKTGVKNGAIHHNKVVNARSVSVYVDGWNTYANNVDVYGNYISGGSAGIAVSSEDGGTADGVRIYNNLITDSLVGIRLPAYDGSSGGTLSNIQIINNDLFDNGQNQGGGIWIGQYWQTYIKGLIIRNNILSQNDAYQIQWSNPGRHSGVTIDYNLFDGNGGAVGGSYVTGNPQFADPGNDDFHLLATSPAIDRGQSAYAPSTDYDGKSRPQGTRIDIGAYER